ncbi:MAG: aminotransferase class V-fold PLP-dependent enzyme, partial [Gemmatimonadetes bacterium]|nr:aminotransferase class V-fold PLP-dependent enzyme [Gemmatimonadota bacterium]
RCGASVVPAPIAPSGELLLERLYELMTPRVKLLGVTHVSNALGTVNPIREIAREARRRGILLLVEGTFLASNLTKIPHGGWLPLLIGFVIFVLMTTWRKGRQVLNAKLHDEAIPLELVIKDVGTKVPRVSGTAVFMTPDPTGAPPVLLHHLKHNKVLHERVVLMSIVNHLVPQVPAAERLETRELGGGFHVVVAH